MTETKPRTTRATRKPKEESQVEVVETEQETELEIKTPEKRILKDTDKITIMNNTTGIYGYTSRNGYEIELEDYGDTLDVPLSELRIMASSQKKHLKEAWIIILDDDVVEEFNLVKDYKTVFTEDGIWQILQSPDKIRAVLPNMNITMKEAVIKMAKRKVEDEELFDHRIFKAIEEVTGVNVTE